MSNKELNYYISELRKVEQSRQTNTMKEVGRLYALLSKKINIFLASVYTDYSNNDGQLTVAMLQEKAQYALFLEEIEKCVDTLTPDITKKIQSTVKKTYKAVYYGMVEATKKCNTNEKVKKCLQGLDVRPEIMKRAIENPISGLTLPDRLEKHRRDVIYEIKQVINIGLINGDRYDTMSKKVRNVLVGDDKQGGYYGKAANIVRTETHRVIEGGLMDCAKDIDKALYGSGFVYAAIWHNMGDNKVRPNVRVYTSKGWRTKQANTNANHVKMEGQLIQSGDLFDLGNGIKADSPGNSGDAANDCRCRCFVEYDTMKIDDFIAKGGKLLERVKVSSSDISENVKTYKPVTLDSESTTIKRLNKDIVTYRVTTAENNICVSENVQLKPKQLHNIDKNINQVKKILNIENDSNLPQIFIVTNAEMQTGALAAYNPIKNTIFFDVNVAIKENVLNMQKQFACSEDVLSTYLHEYIHWSDANEYFNKYGKINKKAEYDKYISSLNKKCKKSLDKLAKKGYNIDSISVYASNEFNEGNYDETYTEYRVKTILEGGKI